MRDRNKKYEMLIKMKNEFVKENSQRRQEKVERDRRQFSEDKNYKLDFFPFTYGE